MNGQVASVDAEAEGDRMEFAEFDAAARHFLDRCDHFATNSLLERIGGDVPGEEREGDQADKTEREKQSPKDAAADERNGRGRRFRRRFGRWLTQRFCSPELAWGVPMWLPERRLASHPVRSSFIFFSASRFLMRPKTSVSGAARSPAFFSCGSN